MCGLRAKQVPSDRLLPLLFAQNDGGLADWRKDGDGQVTILMLLGLELVRFFVTPSP